VQTEKGKNPTKAHLPTINGPKVSKVVEGRGVVMDAVMSPSDHASATKTYKVREVYDSSSVAWSAYPGGNAADRRTTTTQALRAAAEAFVSIFGC
jgi:hypothetical protein